jgi:replication factor C subunit 2/4
MSHVLYRQTDKVNPRGTSLDVPSLIDRSLGRTVPPAVLDHVVGNRAAVDRLRIIARQGNIPNLILTGPPGIGKTTSLLCLCRELLGDRLKEAVIKLNASDERGIEVVRQDIKSFAKRHVNLPSAVTK